MTIERRLPPESQRVTELVRQALLVRNSEPARAVALLGEAARLAIRVGDNRQAALILHRRAALRREGAPAVRDLAMAARLLQHWKPEQALLFLDLGQALAQQGDLRRALLVLQESERLAGEHEEHETVAAARYALAEIAGRAGDHERARSFFRGASEAIIQEIEGDLLSTLRDIGTLPPDPFAARERKRRQEAVESELAELKRQMRQP